MEPGTARLDTALVDRGLARSRTRAHDLIAAGDVAVDGVIVTKPARRVADHAELVVAARSRWVGRAAGKLVGAFAEFDLDARGRRCLDIGASTGGFTQVLLERGAGMVIALDVGHGQLAPEVAGDPRVQERSGTTIRGLQPADIGGRVELAVGDLSFISLRLVLAEIAGLLTEEGEAVLLVKPQFEVGRGRLGRRGVVTSGAARLAAVDGVLTRAAEVGLWPLGLARSPLRGTGGNYEYLVHLTRRPGLDETWEALRVTARDLVQEEE